MSNLYEEPSLLRRSGSKQRNVADDSDFFRSAPLINDGPAPVDHRARAQNLIAKQDMRAKPQTGWKLFSPSTWKGLRDTAWGRNKAVKRQEKELTKRMTKLNSAVKPLDPKSGFFSNATWDTKTGRGITGAEASPDPNLTTSAAYGMSQQAADAWGTAADALSTVKSAEQGSAEWKEQQGRYQQAVDSSGMLVQDFRNMVNLADTRPQQAVAMDGDLNEAGDVVDGHAWLDRPGDDAQDTEGDGIPSIVREVLGPNAGGAGPRPPAGGSAARISSPIDDGHDIESDDDDEEYQNPTGKGGLTQQQMDAYMRKMLN